MSSSEKFKCGYCGWIIWRDKSGQISHGCFGKCKELLMDKDKNLFRNENETGGNSTIEESTYEKENIDENLEEHIDIDKLDEDLISAVKERLYDFRIPVKERGRKQKDSLWQEVSVRLKGLYTATEAEKRWTYLKDCYRKARNIFKKKQSIVQKSGAAGISKKYEMKPSFRHYNVMNFLNDMLEYRQTVTSLRSMCEEQASSCNSIPFTSTSSVDDVLTPITDDNTSTSLSPVLPKSRKKKRIDLDEYEEALIHSLTQNAEPNPIDGFVSRLAEGLHRLSYKLRSKLEIEFLSRIIINSYLK
ncbi:kinesin-related protein 8-like isoform X1 [Linepithema humile]|uniref:kinesin-related protein 8-like isoform X1 n=1 Tax=Linepithema humile TaxID=83485 RepID=UPI00351ECB2E